MVLCVGSNGAFGDWTGDESLLSCLIVGPFPDVLGGLLWSPGTKASPKQSWVVEGVGCAISAAGLDRVKFASGAATTSFSPEQPSVTTVALPTLPVSPLPWSQLDDRL